MCVFGGGDAARRAHGRPGGRLRRAKARVRLERRWRTLYPFFPKTSCFYSIEDCCQLSAPGTLTLHLNLALIAGTSCKMEQRELEVTIISAQDLKNASTFGKMTPYAVAWVYSNMKVYTPIDPKGSVNPTWNAPLKLIVEQRILEQPNATLNVDIYSYGSFSNKYVGSCSVPLSHLKEKDSKGADTKKFMSFLVCIC